MGLFSRKTTEPEVDPNQIQYDFYNDWFKTKYTNLFESEYLKGIKSVFELDLSLNKKNEIKNLEPTSIEECVDATNLNLSTVATIEAGYIVLGRLVIKHPAFLLNKQFEQFYHHALPHQIEALRLLTKVGKEQEYPLNRITASLSKMKYLPNFTIQANEIAAQKNVDIIDLSFYDRFEKVRDDLYLSIIDLVQELQKEANELENGDELTMIDHLLNTAMQPSGIEGQLND